MWQSNPGKSWVDSIRGAASVTRTLHTHTHTCHTHTVREQQCMLSLITGQAPTSALPHIRMAHSSSSTSVRVACADLHACRCLQQLRVVGPEDALIDVASTVLDTMAVKGEGFHQRPQAHDVTGLDRRAQKALIRRCESNIVNVLSCVATMQQTRCVCNEVTKSSLRYLSSAATAVDLCRLRVSTPSRDSWLCYMRTGRRSPPH
jgi:hypothetical protein